MKNFHFLINSRSRPFLLSESLRSIFELADDPAQIEATVRWDEDDETMVRFVSRDNERWPNVKFVRGERPKHLINCYNTAARQSESANVIPWNDDAIMTTRGYDSIFLKAIQSAGFNDRVYYCATSDTSMDKPIGKVYSSFPAVSLAAVKAMGHLMDERFLTLGGDSYLERVFNEIGRIIDCGSVIVDHVLHSTYEKVVSPDNTARVYRDTYAENFIDPFTASIEEDVKKLRAVMT